jgi:hypothetical protein
MRQWLGLLTASLALVLGGSYAWVHRNHVANAVAVPAAVPSTTQPNYAEVRDAQKAVTIAGPLADYMSSQNGSKQEPSKVETISTIAYKPTASDHVGGSPVGTSNLILHQTFRVAGIVNLPFEVPAHAANAQLRGTYRSFVKRDGALASDAAADVEFLLLNEQQYDEFLNGRAGEAVFSADDSHSQEVNTGLPPTLAQAAKYHLVFRNNSRDHLKKVVEADFRIDF